MKAIVSGVIGLIIISTVVFAQNLDKKEKDRNNEKNRLAVAIEYVKQETIGGKLDFTYVLDGPDFLPIEHNGVRFNRNDYHVFLWGKAVSDLQLGSTEDAARLWEKIHDQKLTNPQRTALRIGYEKKLE